MAVRLRERVEELPVRHSASVARAAAAVRRPSCSQGTHQLHTAVVRNLGVYGMVADGYGLAHFVEALSDGREAVWHGG